MQTSLLSTSPEASLMAPAAVGIGTLRRLRALESPGGSVLSAYLSLDDGGLQSAEARERELDALTSGWQSAQEDMCRLRTEIHDMPALAHGTRGLACFSSDGGAAFAAVPLPSSVEAMAVLDTLAWLEPIAGIFTTGDTGVAVVGRRTARVLRGSPRTLVEFAAVRDKRHVRGILGEYPRLAPLGRPVQEHIGEHVHRVSELLMRAHQRRAFDALVVLAPPALWPVIEQGLHGELRSHPLTYIAGESTDVPERQIARILAAHSQAERVEYSSCFSMTPCRHSACSIGADHDNTCTLSRTPTLTSSLHDLAHPSF